MLTELADVADAPRVEPARDLAGPDPDGRIAENALGGRAAGRIVGGAGWTHARRRRAARFAERFDLPMSPRSGARARRRRTPQFRRRNRPRANPKLKARIEEADLVLLIGGRMSEAPSQGYTLFGIPRRARSSSTSTPTPHEIGRNYHPRSASSRRRRPSPRRWRACSRRRACLGERRARRARTFSPGATSRRPTPGAVQLGEIMFALRRLVPDAIFANGAGNFAIWAGRFLRFRRFEQQLGPTSGSMGFGLPAAIAAKQAVPRTHRRRLRRRRRLPDERAGIRHRRPIRLPMRRHRRRQRHLRHDPHASGARISRPRRRRRHCAIPTSPPSARLWRPRRDGARRRRNSSPPSSARWRRASRRSCM